MHRIVTLALLLPCPALADTILAKSQITAVTLYPQGAQVTRVVSFNAPAGTHDLLITDLPAGTEPNLIRLTSPDLALGAFALRTDRLPPRSDAETPALLAATADVTAAKAALRDAQAAVAAINARVEAAQAQVAFLAALRPEGAALTVESLTALTQTVGAQTLAARQAALAATADLPPAQTAAEAAQQLLDAAIAARAALSQRDSDYTALSVAIDAPAAGEAHLTVSHFIQNATWSPVYDMTLDRKAASLRIDRGVLVSQYSGEDWAGVDLTLSTAQPSAQSDPSTLWPDLRQVFDPATDAPPVYATRSEAMVADAAPMPKQVGMTLTAVPMLQGETVVYHYPSAVAVASGVENLRLALDSLTMTPDIEARAVPSRDRSAFLLATLTNVSPEILLPGTASLYRDSALVGSVQFAGLAAGAKAEIGFGAIEGLRLKRSMPERSTGDRGFISTSTQQEETAVLTVENLTAEAWPLRVLDQIPYSEQEDLKISFTADPAPSETDFDGQRGILSWQFDLAAGVRQQITLSQKLTWPEGKVLQ